MSMSPSERITFSPVFGRPKLQLPNNARMVIWPLLAMEVWDVNRPMPRVVLAPPQGNLLTPDIPNWSWHEYGMRSGIWRLIQMFDDLNIRPCVTLNARACTDYPQVTEAILKRGWEFNAHSYDQIAMHKVENQQEMIEKTLDIIAKFSGRKPRGWFGPGLTQTFETLDHLAKAGIQYFGDWVLDDHPIPVKTRHGDIVALPYNYEIHDIAQQMIQFHESEIFLKRAKDYFDCLYEESAENARFMCVATHPYISGVPHRIKYVREAYEYFLSKPGVIVMDGEEILDWYLTQNTDINLVGSK